jgi:methyl acetate hydrolase
MSNLDAVLSEAGAANDVPFVVTMAGTSDGVAWSGTAGVRAPEMTATENTIFRINSMTKAVGVIAVMILIDRGKLNLHTCIEDILPSFADLCLLKGFDGDTPLLRPPKHKATVEQLETHPQDDWPASGV